ncbi:MAG: VWA domain-containing protein [Candidatus Heimdallarchaeaceae archaeon]
MKDIELELKYEEVGDNAKISKNVADKIGVIPGDIIIIEDTISREEIGLISVTDETVSDDVILIDSNIGDATGFLEDTQVKITRYTGSLTPVNKIVIGVELKDSSKYIDIDKLIQDIREKIFELKKYIDGKLIKKDAVLYWKQYDVYLHILETEPELEDKVFSKIDWEVLKEVSLKRKDKSIPFNGVLLLDVSQSMETIDMEIRSITAIHGLKDHISETSSTKSFFDQFSEETQTERYKAATLAALIYVTEKLGRGSGEKVAFIHFSDNAELIQVCGQDWYESGSCQIDDLMETIIQSVEKAPHGYTNMTAALEKAIEISQKFGDPDTKPIMFVLLTDGYPNDENAVRNTITKITNNMPNVVLYTIGIGEGLNDILMEEIAADTGGVYFKVSDLKELLRWYSKLAHDIAKRIKLK